MKKQFLQPILIASCYLFTVGAAIAQKQNVLADYNITSSASVTAAKSITASRQISGSSTVVTFTAGQEIHFLPGFSVSGTSHFTAQIESLVAKPVTGPMLGEASELSNFEIYPNPLQGKTTIRISDSGDGLSEIIIYTLRGQEVSRFRAGDSSRAGKQEVSFDASHFQPGLYIVELTQGSKKESKKIIKL